MKIEEGWRFNSADFSIQAAGNSGAKGSVTLIRSPEEKERWHAMPDELKEDYEGPPLTVIGRGLTLEYAIINANLAAAHAKPIPREEFSK